MYKLVDGKCAESYGLNVARMASIPEAIVEKANLISNEFDQINTFNATSSHFNLGDLTAFSDLVNVNVGIDVKHRTLQGIAKTSFVIN